MGKEIKKTNRQFMIMSAIGIIMVVDSHSWTTIHIAESLFPYNCFFMAMFFFISGYFFNAEKTVKDPIRYIKRKTKVLFLPYLGWWFAYLFIGVVMRRITTFKIGPAFSFYDYFVGPLVCGEFNGLNSPAYFVPILFYVICFHTLFRTVFDKIWNEFITMFIYAGIGMMVVCYSIKVAHIFDYNTAFMMLLKIAFSLQFFEFGVIYRNKLEQHFEKIHPLAVAIIAIFIISIIKHYIPNINWHLNRLDFEVSLKAYGVLGYLIPAVTATLGISFWLEVAKVMTPALGNSKICNFISNHTFGIMEHHLFCMFLLNAALVIINSAIPINNLNVEAIKSTAWYRFAWGGKSDFYIFYFLAGIIGSCLICILVDRIKQKIKHCYCLMRPAQEQNSVITKSQWEKSSCEL